MVHATATCHAAYYILTRMTSQSTFISIAAAQSMRLKGSCSTLMQLHELDESLTRNRTTKV